MHTNIILADSIDGGVLMILIIGGGLAVSVLALCALVPAWQRNLGSTLVLAGPALIWGVGATLCFIYWYLHEGLGSPDYTLRDFLPVLVIMAGPPLVTSLLAVFCLWFRKGRVK